MIIWDRIKWLHKNKIGRAGFSTKKRTIYRENPRNHWFLMDPPIAMAAPKSARKQRSPVDANEICCPPERQMQTLATERKRYSTLW